MFTGSFINIFTILLGSFIGIIVRKNLNENLKSFFFNIAGVVTLVIGIHMSLSMKNLIIVVLSVFIGGFIGQILNFEDKINNIVENIKNKLQIKEHHFTEGFLTASLIFCIGSMAIIGSIDSGIRGDHTVLITKSILDGFMSAILSSTFGIGVLFSFIPVFVYQGTITFFASILQVFLSDFMIEQLTATGGILIIGLSLVLLKLKEIKMMNLSFALIIVVLLSYLYEYYNLSSLSFLN